MTKRMLGGSKQKLAQLEAEEEQAKSSNLAAELLGLWSWGNMSAPLVQSLAMAAFKDGLQHPEIERMAKIGAGGKFPANMQRDLMTISGNFPLLKAETVVPNIRVKSLKQEGFTEAMDLKFILPHKLFAILFESVPTAFQSSVLGEDASNVPRFWAAMKDNPVLAARPDLQGRADLAKVVPIALHGDGVAYQQVRAAGGKSLEVLSWSSLLSKGPTKTNSFLMFLIAKSLVKDQGIGQTWPRVWRVLSWSLRALSAGVWPMTNWDNEDFEEGSLDFEKRGTPLADGFSGVVFVLRSDIEFLALHFKLNHPSSNFPCALCQADRAMDSKPWTDCRPSAEWRKTCWSLEGWAAQHPDSHPFFQMQGSGIDLVFPDLMHCKHLGTDQLVLGSALVWMAKHYLKGSVAENLEVVWDFIQRWYKELACPTKLKRGFVRAPAHCYPACSLISSILLKLEAQGSER